jgi:hypothetical protein
MGRAPSSTAATWAVSSSPAPALVQADKGVEVTLDLQLFEVNAGVEKGLKEEINCELLRLADALAQKEVALHQPAGDEKREVA